eukprot:815608-Rhodomonas_salina.1
MSPHPFRSSREGHLAVVRILLKKGADVNVENIAGLTPQQLAERSKRPEIAALLAEGPAAVEEEETAAETEAKK